MKLSISPAEPWHTPTFLAHVFTFRLARELTGLDHNVTTVENACHPPFCLRIKKPYRSKEAQAFRDTVAREARKRRNE